MRHVVERAVVGGAVAVVVVLAVAAYRSLTCEEDQSLEDCLLGRGVAYTSSP